MMTIKKLFTKTLTLLSLLIACSCGEDSPDILPVGETLPGGWIMTEYGYSPGGDYVTKDVPADPAKTITFNLDGTVSSNVDGFSNYQYYLIMESSQAPESRKIVALFTEKPQGGQDYLTVSPAYYITFTEDLLKLSMRGCIEGCHVGLKRIAKPGSGNGQ